MERMVRSIVAAALLVLGGCGGDSGPDEDAFSDWYTGNQERRREFLEDSGTDEADYEIYTAAEGLAQARSLCRELEQSEDLVDLEGISNRMENSLSGRHFVDAAVEWICPGEAHTVDDLIDAGTLDMRALCEENPEADIGCGGPPADDPLDD